MGGHPFCSMGGILSALQKFRENWVRPALFFGNNPISLAGGAITTASGVTMIGYWLVELIGRPNANPYLGIIFFLILPALFILGLALIPVGIFFRRRVLLKAGQIPAAFQRSDLSPRRRYRPARDNCEPACSFGGELSRCSIHGFAPVLRAIVPCNASGVHGLQNFCALACGLRRLPHRLGFFFLFCSEGERH